MRPDELFRWKRVEQVLDQLLEAEPSERAALLERLAAGDPSLRREVEELLAADEAAGGFLERPAFAVLGITGETPLPVPTDASGRRIGPYRLLRQLGRGGMGTVHLAERADGQFRQQVALKLIRQDAGSPELVQRFLSERQILARLNHAHIARLLDGGTTPEGQPWFALEYVEGESITAYADHRSLSLEQRFDLFTQVADAVRHAHAQGVIHRDLKPSNILVTAEGDVKLLDFGIAKDTTSSTDPPTRQSGAVLTPEYCAPEQVLGQPATVATDVYAIGTVLYELLTGRRAHRLDQHAPGAVYQAVCETEVVPPSMVVLEQTPGSPNPNQLTAQARGLDSLHLSRCLRGDLDAILLRALQKSPADRYLSVDELLDDIQRHRSGDAVRARQATTGYLFRTFVRRHRRPLVAALLIVIAGAGFLMASSLGGLSDLEGERTAVARRLFEEGRRAHRRLDLLGAQRLYHAALAEDSSLADAAYYAGQLAFVFGDAAEGYRLIHDALLRSEQLPRFEQLRLQYAWAELGNSPARLTTARSLLQSFPEDPVALHTYGGAMAWTGWLDSAVVYYQRAIDRSSSWSGAESGECIICDSYSGLARSYLDLDSTAAAVRTVREWLVSAPDSVGALEVLAIALTRLGRYDEAMETYRLLVQKGPHQSELLWVYSVLMIHSGRITELIRTVEEQTRIHGFAEAQWFRIIALRNAGRIEEALKLARLYRASFPTGDTLDTGWVRAAMLEAQVLRERGDLAASAALFDTTASAVIPWSWVGPGIAGRARAWTLTQEATSLAALGDTSRLSEVADRVFDHAPQSAWVREARLTHYARGLLFRARGTPDSALHAFLRASHPGFAAPDLAAASLLIRAGRAPDAVPMLQRTIRYSDVQASRTYHTITEVHLALARAFDAAGSRDSARFHYLWVAQAWQEGDPPFRSEARKAALRASLLFSR